MLDGAEHRVSADDDRLVVTASVSGAEGLFARHVEIEFAEDRLSVGLLIPSTYARSAPASRKRMTARAAHDDRQAATEGALCLVLP